MANNWIKTVKSTNFRNISSPEYVQLEREIRRVVNAMGVGGTASWGGIIGNILDQIDLQTVLNGKLDSVNTLGIGESVYESITGQTINLKGILDNGGINVTSDANNVLLENAHRTIQSMTDTFFGALVLNDLIQWDGASWVNIQPSTLPISNATQTALNGKQDTLVSGTNIKTVNGNSLLGSGNVVITSSSAFAYYETAVNYTALLSDFTINVTAANVQITLPTAVGNTGYVFNIKNSSDGEIEILPNGLETIDSESVITISQPKASVTVQSTGTNWIII